MQVTHDCLGFCLPAIPSWPTRARKGAYISAIAETANINILQCGRGRNIAVAFHPPLHTKKKKKPH